MLTQPFAEEEQFFVELGTRLREARLAKNETQDVFSERLGVSRQTLMRMEAGHGGRLPILVWFRAMSFLGMTEPWKQMLQPEDSLFSQVDSFSDNSRKRAARRQR